MIERTEEDHETRKKSRMIEELELSKKMNRVKSNRNLERIWKKGQSIELKRQEYDRYRELFQHQIEVLERTLKSRKNLLVGS